MVLVHGHFKQEPNKNLIFKEKPNNMGIYIGNIQKINSNKGHLTLKLEDTLSIGDKISINNEKYTVSELMIKNDNFASVGKGNIVTIGRMKGRILNNSEVYRIESAKLNKYISNTFRENAENKKIPLIGEITIKENLPITLKVCSNEGFYSNLSFTATSTSCLPQIAQNQPISSEKVFEQIAKTGNTEFEFKNLKINLDNNLFIPVKILNELKRDALNGLEKLVLDKYSHDLKFSKELLIYNKNNKSNNNVSLLLNTLNFDYDYSKLENINKLYIPLRYFNDIKYEKLIKNLSFKFNIYVYLPNILKDEKLNSIDFDNLVKKFNIKGFVISHISQIIKTNNYNLELIGNFTLNIYNDYAVRMLENIGFSTFTPSVELTIQELNNINSNINSEILVYGKIPVMTNNYCYLGKSNKCYKDCKKLCKNNSVFYLKDRMNSNLRIIPDNTLSITTVFSHKPISIETKNLTSNSIRIDILDEPFEEIQNIIKSKRTR